MSAGAAAASRSAVLTRLTTRAWKDERFRQLLFSHPQEALVAEFGSVPAGFENVSFRPREVDRMRVRQSAAGVDLLVRPKRGDRPISVVSRQVLGIPELVVVFYSKRCQYQCSFCTLPSTSAYSDVSTTSILDQLEAAFAAAGAQLATVRQVSLGNEGSILDEDTFTREQLDLVLSRCRSLPAVDSLVLETRAEFVTPDRIDQILERISPARLTLKIGLESANDVIREQVLRKKMDLPRFERTVQLMGQKGVALAAYVLLKADPAHDDAAGREDARQTCRYLKELCRRTGTRLTLRLNAMYAAEGSPWTRWAAEKGWTPPSIFDLAEVMWEVREESVPVFAGLSEEGLATRSGHYEARPDFQTWALRALEGYNETMDLELLARVARHRAG